MITRPSIRQPTLRLLSQSYSNRSPLSPLSQHQFLLHLQRPRQQQQRTLSAFPTDIIPPTFSPTSHTPIPNPHVTGDSSVNDAGVLEEGGQEVAREKGRYSSYLYLDSVFPIRLHMLDPRYLLAQMETTTLLDKVRSLVPLDSVLQTRVEAVLPREKDGGAWVKFSYVLPSQPFTEGEEGEVVGEEAKAEIERRKEEAERLVEKEVRDAVAARDHKEWFLSRQTRVFLVKGKPWMEDMNRFVNTELRVEIEGPDIPQEMLYSLFRPYGRIHDIVPPNPKDSPKFARIIYTSLRSAAAARNSLHSYAFSPSPSATPTTLRILFAERVRAHYIRDWAASHPRIMLPLIVALLGGVSWAIFDPVREFFIRHKVEGTWEADRWTILNWLKRETLGRLGLGVKSKAGEGRTGIERERDEAKEQLAGWLKDVPDSFIIVSGPRGSGKTALVDEVTSEYDNVLTIDCAALCKNARSETKLVSELASAVGYWPQFVLAASLNNMIDLAAVGLIGQKAGFGSTLDAQLKQILEVTSSALKSLASERNARALSASQHAEGLRMHADERKQVIEQMEGVGIRDGRLDAVAGNGMMSELGAGVERPGRDGVVILGPTSAMTVKEFITAEHESDCQSDRIGGLPVVVIKSFASKGEAKQEVLWSVLSDWAAVLVENQVAHVIFTSDSVTANKPLAKALPNKPFNSIALNDASPDAALQYIEAKLSDLEVATTLSETSKSHLAKLGGRQTDLELLVQKIRAGFGPREAVDDIVGRSATELRKNFFGDDDEEAKSFKWTREQAWALAKGLAAKTELKYADVLVNSPFKSDESSLRALENAEMISIHHREGRPSVIRPGRPVYRSAFQQLQADPVFAASIEYQINAAATASAQKDLDGAQKALIDLSALFGGNGKWAFGGSATVPKEIEVRVTALLAGMRGAEEKLVKLDGEKARLLKVLAEAE